MKCLIVALIAFLPLAVFGEDTQTQSNSLSSFSWFAGLTGSCWKGKYADGKSVDTQCYEIEYGKFISGTISIIDESNPQKPPYNGKALFAWDSAKNKITYYYWSDSGLFGSSEGYIEGDQLFWPLKAGGSDEIKSRTIWKRINRDSFQVTRENKNGESWKQAFVVTYNRIK